MTIQMIPLNKLTRSPANVRKTGADIGRMYRKFINDGRLTIRLVALEGDIARFDKPAKANDPLYLMDNSSTPAPFDKKAMFQKWGETGEEIIEVEYGGTRHPVTIRMSYARPETIPDDGLDRGRKDYGKHAAANVGISILRAGRELDLDDGWTNSYNPVERWWGIEVEFPPALDEVFGVPNNKQAANNFSQMANFNWKDETQPGESLMDLRRRMEDDGDPRAYLVDIAHYIREKALPKLRSLLDEQTKYLRSKGRRYEDTSVEDRASTKFKERAEQGHPVQQDEEVFDQGAKESLVQDLIDNKNYSERAAQEIAEAAQKRGRRVLFLEANLDGYAFFKVDHKPGITEIVFNKNHPAHEQLMKCLEIDSLEDATDKQLIDRITGRRNSLPTRPTASW